MSSKIFVFLMLREFIESGFPQPLNVYHIKERLQKEVYFACQMLQILKITDGVLKFYEILYKTRLRS